MEAELRALVSQAVREVGDKPRESRISFANGSTLVITWPCRKSGLGTRGLAGLIGQRLVSISAGNGQISLEFFGGGKLLVEVIEDVGAGGSGFYLTTRQGRQVEWPVFDEEAA